MVGVSTRNLTGRDAVESEGVEQMNRQTLREDLVLHARIRTRTSCARRTNTDPTQTQSVASSPSKTSRLIAQNPLGTTGKTIVQQLQQNT